MNYFKNHLHKFEHIFINNQIDFIHFHYLYMEMGVSETLFNILYICEFDTILEI